MTYHSLAIYYDNQVAENEQKRVPRDNRFANLQDSIEVRKWRTMVLQYCTRASFLEEGCAPTFQFLSQHALSYHAALGSHYPPVGLLGVSPFRAHHACGHARLRAGHRARLRASLRAAPCA